MNLQLFAKQYGTSFDIQKYIETELSKGQKTIVIPKGQYRVTPVKKQHLLLKDLKNITIDASNVEMICTETTRAITILNCENLTIKGLTIDYDPLCFTKGTIVAMSPDKSTIDFRLEDGYPDKLSTMKIEIFDSQTQLLRRHTYYGWQPIQKIEDKTYRLQKATKYSFNQHVDLEKVGDVIVASSVSAPNGSIPHAVLSDNCKNLRLENITLYSGPTFAFFETNGTSNTYYRCVIDRRPQHTDIVNRSQRLRSNNADAFHSKYAYVGPKIIECAAQFQGDDGVNICGLYYFVISGAENTINIISRNDMMLTKNSVIGGITSLGKRLPDVKMLDVKETGIVNEEIKALIRKLYLHAKIKDELVEAGLKIYTITIEKPVTVDFGTLISDCNRTGNGFLVKDCNFSNNRSRGILIKASNGTVEGNKLVGNWMHSILVSPEAYWLESGCSDNVVIKDNTISNNQSKQSILIDANCISRQTPPVGIHNNISITNNLILNSPFPVIQSVSVNGLQIENNRVDSTPLIEKDHVELVNCENVTISKN